ncbi:tRNA (guanine-N(1)-)-methyltransferase [Thraustotheca clavata]|uniref:tRNA (guanine(37)-N1)-methyltransferase n=1 Tax=Thraustotheca clavata TaxID=74557 RepID=A0A1W0A2R7_9STRA|nr:tRNA (guanine-N(1)-)-methyltransferase [Thraustotheca clavata]
MSSNVLDRSLFIETLKVMGVRAEGKHIGQIVKQFSDHLLNRPKLKNVVSVPAAQHKLVLLNEKIQGDELVNSPKALQDYIKQENLSVQHHEITLDYSFFGVDQVLRKLMPESITEIPSSFETIGHIAHINLRDFHLPYKHLIGQVILDKNQPRIKTVVNKIDTIDTVFRTFPMEVLAGEDNMVVELNESGCVFNFNFAEVYWNSRLQQEHLRMIRQFSTTDVICDMMCGIGPFAVPLAKKGCKVYANDLNPKSYEYLNVNRKKNKVEANLHTFNMDGRDFVHKLLDDRIQFSQVLMNLPAIALEFLDAFPGRFDHWEGELPWIHTYCFSSQVDAPELDVQKRAEAILGASLDMEKTKIYQVRDVAPKKLMMCISFQLPVAAAYSEEKRQSMKRIKLQ